MIRRSSQTAFAPVRPACAVAVVALFGCGSDSTTPPTGDAELAVEVAAQGLESPVHLTAPPGDGRLFVVEQPGRIRIVDATGTLLPTPFLDIADRVVDGGERGLLSMAFHPDYPANPSFFVNYTGAGGATRIERYRVSSDPNRAAVGSAALVLTVAQPFANHNGGQLAFGPDGMLYIGMGDGGSGGDPLGHGQNPATLLGALLRIDVDSSDPYAIPPDNPFAGIAAARSEIWAIGLRNPWRFSFDLEGGVLFIADVGQSRLEEINAVDAGAAGLNYGWNIMEGSTCFSPPSGCDTRDLVLPVHEYANSGAQCAVTGGHVYRGSAIPAARGTYFYSDFCGGTLRSFRLTEDKRASDHRIWQLPDLGNVTSFGVDGAGEMYILVQQGTVYRLVASDDP